MYVDKTGKATIDTSKFKTLVSQFSSEKVPNIIGSDRDSRVKTRSSILLDKIRAAGDEVATNIVDVPEIDYSKFTDEDWNNSIWDSMAPRQATTPQTGAYPVDKNENLDKILANEFKTSDKQTHEILQKIYEYLENRDKSDDDNPTPSGGGNQKYPNPHDMFQDKIPNSVYRLARG
jgi:hypothetical protein